jgi:hypothetical protein
MKNVLLLTFCLLVHYHYGVKQAIPTNEPLNPMLPIKGGYSPAIAIGSDNLIVNQGKPPEREDPRPHRKESEFTPELIVDEIAALMVAESRDAAFAAAWENAQSRLMTKSAPIGIAANSLRGLPIIIANSGPTLQQDLPGIKESGMPVMAVDNAVGSLVKAGIMPFLIVTTDMQENCAEMIEPGITEKTFIAVAPWVHEKTLQLALKGKIFIYTLMTGDPDGFIGRFNQKYKGITQVSASATVGTVAFAVAMMMRCDPAIMSGLDLCYYKKADVPQQKSIVELENGKFTMTDFLASKMWYEMGMEKIKDGSRKIHTSTMLALKGAEKLTFEEILKEYPNRKYPNPTWAMEKCYNKYLQRARR